MKSPVSLNPYAAALTAVQQNDWQQAYELSVLLLQQAPDHPGASYLAGLAALELQQWHEALVHLHRAAKLAPRNAVYVAYFARALSFAGMPGNALRTANRAFNLSPTDAHTWAALGDVYKRCNALERATVAFGRAAALAPTNPHFRYNYAESLMHEGDLNATRTELEACLSLDPAYWKAYRTLSRLHRQSPHDNHVDRLLALVGQTRDDNAAQVHLHLTLGKEYEDLGDYSRAFEHFSQGKAAISGGHENLRQRDQALFDAIMRMFPGPQPQPDGFPTDEPIFVVGMPRSGTTLVERIISSHPYVHSAGELHNFGIALKQVTGVSTPPLLDLETLAKTNDLDWVQLGEKYLASTRPMTECKPRFIDKLPHNFLYLGHIARALPNAKIICLRRNPMDTCLSNFRQLFARNSEFHNYSLDLLDTGRYYLLFDRLMAHWKRVLPGRILEVQYETLVQTQEASTRQLLEHCDLPWHDDCLRFEQNGAPVATASAVQVRSPIYRTSIKYWKKYEVQLTDLHKLLIEAGVDCEN